MKIVIPSNDNEKIARHFGKSKGFTIIEVEDNQIVCREHKENTFTDHAKGGANKAQGEHHHDHDHNHDQEHHGNHSHEGIFKTIGDCQVVIGGGMGRRLYNDFQDKGIDVYVTQETLIDDAMQLFLEGKLDNNTEKCCNH